MEEIFIKDCNSDGGGISEKINIALHFVDVMRSLLNAKLPSPANEKYQTFLKSIEAGYYEVDIAGNFTFFNGSILKILGYAKDELIGMNNRQYMDKENSKKVYETFNKVYNTGELARAFDWEIIRKEGTKRHVEASVSLIKDADGQRIGFRGILRDVTERKQIEAELIETKNFLQNILDSSIDGIITTDLKGNVIYTSPRTKDILLDVFITQDLKICVKFLLHTKGQGMSRYWILVSGYWINQGMPFLCLSSI